MNCYRVSELNNLTRSILSETFGEDTWVVGEIHGFKLHDRSGHAYFDIVEKDARNPGQYIAKISCAFFKGSVLSWKARLRREGLASFTLSDGLEVKVRASVELYVKEGKYQLVVNDIDASYSLGAMAKKRQQTIDELKKSGLMEKNKGLSLNDCPLRIGLITSAGSAAYKDFISVLNASGYAFKIFLFNAYMQGEQTSKDIVRGIATLEKLGLDAIAIIRGGGSRTDLSYFDDTTICTAIAKSVYPVLTGIGHEIDLSVADMVSYRHFVTPTDTARFLTSLLDDFWFRIDETGSMLGSSAISLLEKGSDRLKMLAYKVTLSVSGMTKTAEGFLHTAVKNLGMAAARVFSQAAGRLGVIKSPLSPAVRTIIRAAGIRLTEYENLVKVMDPASILKRGFSMTMRPDGSPLIDAVGTEEGDRLKTVLYRGSLTSIVESREII
jgi:exodeoxyribonuclease VII large subunit